MLVRDEDAAEVTHRQLRQSELASDAITTVHEIDAITDDDRLCRRRAPRLGSRTTGRAEQHEPCASLCRAGGACERRVRKTQAAGGEKSAPGYGLEVLHPGQGYMY